MQNSALLQRLRDVLAARIPVRGVATKSASAVQAVTSDPFVAGRYFKYQSYKSDRHGCDSAIFNNIIFACHRPTSTQS